MPASGITRREALRKGTLAGLGMVWVTPAVTSIEMTPALAQATSGPTTDTTQPRGDTSTSNGGSSPTSNAGSTPTSSDVGNSSTSIDDKSTSTSRGVQASSTAGGATSSSAQSGHRRRRDRLLDRPRRRRTKFSPVICRSPDCPWNSCCRWPEVPLRPAPPSSGPPATRMQRTQIRTSTWSRHRVLAPQPRSSISGLGRVASKKATIRAMASSADA